MAAPSPGPFSVLRFLRQGSNEPAVAEFKSGELASGRLRMNEGEPDPGVWARPVSMHCQTAWVAIGECSVHTHSEESFKADAWISPWHCATIRLQSGQKVCAQLPSQVTAFSKNSTDPIKCVLKPCIFIKEKNLDYLKISFKEVGLWLKLKASHYYPNRNKFISFLNFSELFYLCYLNIKTQYVWNP